MIHLLSVIGSLWIQKAFAQSYQGAFAQYCTILHDGCGSGASFPAEFAIKAGNFVVAFVGIVAVLAVIYGGFKIITSAGNEQGIEEAKKIIGTALIGLILAIASEAVIIYIQVFVTP